MSNVNLEVNTRLNRLIVSPVSALVRFVSACGFVVAFVVVPVVAQTPPLELPDTGIDVGEYVTAFGTAMGTAIAVIVGLYFAFLLVRKGMRWARSAA